MIKIYTVFLGVFILLASQSCQDVGNKTIKEVIPDSSIVQKSDTIPNAVTLVPLVMGKLEKGFMDAGLVNVQLIDSTVQVSLKYSTKTNFLGVDVYGELEKAYFQPEVAVKLACAQELLKTKYPGYNLLIYDAVRPRSIQQVMWDTIKVSAWEKTKYLSNPKYGSLHNYGAAVDISIVDSAGEELDMGTEYDYFGELAYPQKEYVLLSEGKLTKQQVENRKLLRSVMTQAGFFNIQTEWWHFNSCTRQVAAAKYKIIE